MGWCMQAGSTKDVDRSQKACNWEYRSVTLWDSLQTGESTSLVWLSGVAAFVIVVMGWVRRYGFSGGCCWDVVKIKVLWMCRTRMVEGMLWENTYIGGQKLCEEEGRALTWVAGRKGRWMAGKEGYGNWNGLWG